MRGCFISFQKKKKTMCKEVDNSPKEEKPQPTPPPRGEPPAPAPAPPPPKPEPKAPEPEPPKEEELTPPPEEQIKEFPDPTWVQPSIAPAMPEPSVYSNYVTGRDPALLTSSDEMSNSDISDFPSQTSQSADRKLDRLPIK